MKYLLGVLLSLLSLGTIGQDSLRLDEEAWRKMVKDVNYDEEQATAEKEEYETGSNTTNRSWNIDDSFWQPIFFGIIIVVILVFILLIIRRSRIPVQVNERRTEARTLEEAEENLPDVTLNNIYSEALEEGDYKSALRIRFLMILQKMIDEQMITWKKWKTNEQYAAELSSGHLQNLFAGIVKIFDEAWYGDVALTQSAFEEAVQRIDELNTKMHG